MRRIGSVHRNQPTMEGAGVRLKRVFGFHEVPKLDPFLLLDHFGSQDPNDYLPGFPWHPHRGIETVTYMLEGEVEHGDSLGNGGVIGGGDVQWMTAGSGIIHQEMPLEYNGTSRGFQLWVNLPRSEKMMGPRYRDVARDSIPLVEVEGGARVKVVAGKFRGVEGPVRDLVVDCGYIDVELAADGGFEHPVPEGYSAFVYVFQGEGAFGAAGDRVNSDHLGVLKGDGGLTVRGGTAGVRFLLVYGRPLNEPVAWRGPIVMNTQQELDLAFRQLRDGTFIR